MTPNINVFERPEDAAHAVAELILTRSKEKKKQSQPYNIALSGGSTPKLLFTVLAQEYLDSVPWHLVRFFWVDERCVPPTHPESNFGLAYKHLLKKVPVPDANIFRMQGEADPQGEAFRYQTLLEKELPMHKGYPQFDLVLLGMGEDGHTASIFPNNMKLLHSEVSVAVGIHPDTGQKRLTLTGRTINQANQVVFMVTGASKSNVLSQIIQMKPDNDKLPASYVHSQSGTIDFYLDKAAANEL